MTIKYTRSSLTQNQYQPFLSIHKGGGDEFSYLIGQSNGSGSVYRYHWTVVHVDSRMYRDLCRVVYVRSVGTTSDVRSRVVLQSIVSDRQYKRRARSVELRES